MNWLILLYFLEIGYSPIYQYVNTIDNITDRLDNNNVYYLDLGAEVVLFDHFFIGGETKTFMQPQLDSYMFYPIENDYLFKAGVRFNNIEAGFRHQCNHPVGNYEVATNGKSYGAFEEFYIRITN